ncbi:hypothetical protein [uncultured Nostoc sp.]|uniref:hypothetical protein n=1 Tax=uncultured Nostoc sp. TaxID=340711 RepID=UPI0035CAEDB6
MPTLKKLLRSLLKVTKEGGLNKMQNFILSLASLSFIRRGIEGEVSPGHKLYVI